MYPVEVPWHFAFTTRLIPALKGKIALDSVDVISDLISFRIIAFGVSD